MTVTIENIAPSDGVALTPVWVGFHTGSFDSYNGGLRSLPALERLAEDGNNAVISAQFNDFDPVNGGYTFVDNSGSQPRSRLVRTGDLNDVNRQDATLGGAPLLPGDSASQQFVLLTDGSNDFFSYASMVLPTNDFFVANGNPTAHDISAILATGGQITFLIGTPNGGVNDAGTEREDFGTSAGNPLFPGRNLPAGQSGPDVGRRTRRPITNVVDDAFAAFVDRVLQVRIAVTELNLEILNRIVDRFPVLERVLGRSISRLEGRLARLESQEVNTDGFNFNEYDGGIARVTITADITP
ncbi:MAG: spondin domain-containing protein [Planctomycetaceae bacterium]|nr:spondin domain-containing protein [Planctomycetaceae bacterium]